MKSSDDQSARKLVKKFFPPKPFSEWIPDNTPNVVYLNNTATLLNSKYPNIYDHTTYSSTFTVLCKQHLVVTGTLTNSGKKPIKYYTNTLYTVVYHPNSPMIAPLGNTDPAQFVKISKPIYEKHFAPPHARTCYSLQGLTVGPSINVFDINLPLVDKHWLITALSRATTLDIRIYNNPVEMPSKLANRIESYKQQDLARFGIIIGDYITPAWILARLSSPICIHCNDDISNTWEVDRIDNLLPHIIGNCALSCPHCNRSKK